MIRFLALGAALGASLAHALLAAAPIEAQPRTAAPAERGVPLSAFPRLVPLAPNVYGYEALRAPGFTTVSLVVVGTQGVLIADAQGSAEATRRLLDDVRRLTPRPVRWYVVGSDHGDHTAGNHELPAGVTWIIHPTSRAQLQRDSSAALAAVARASADSAAAGRPAPVPRPVIVPPAAMSGDREVIDLGGITVEVRFLGRAHTGGDLMVHLPRERLLFMSEAYLNRVFPAMRSAYPSEWVRVLDAALAMPVERYVAGHGFIEEPAVSREELVAFRDALRAVIAEVTRAHARGLTREEAVAQVNWGPYARWFLAEQQGPIAVRRIYDELDGRLR